MDLNETLFRRRKTQNCQCLNTGVKPNTIIYTVFQGILWSKTGLFSPPWAIEYYSH